MKAPYFRHVVFLLVFGIFLALVTVEIGLRLAGWTLKMGQEFENIKSSQKSGTYKIMCIGESTTAGGKDSYPSILESILNEKSHDLTFSVINKGDPGKYSTRIVNNLEANLDKYQPDMVIVMMGINDIIYRKGNFLPYADENPSFILKSLHSLKIYKLFHWMTTVRFNSVDDMESRFSMIQKDPDRWSESINYSKKGDVLKNQKQYLKAEQSYIMAIEAYPQNIIPYMLLAELYSNIHEPEKLKKIYELAIENNTDFDWGYAGLSHAYELLGDTDKATEYRKKSREIRSMKYNTLVKFSFLKIKDILDRRKIKLVCMQYPLRDVDSLRRIFEGEEGVDFIDNEDIFLKAISKEGYSAIFVDNFAGDFGHGTPKGNRLLAENVADYILD